MSQKEEPSKMSHSEPVRNPEGTETVVATFPVGPAGVGRRSFLKLAGFTLAGTAVSGCRRPVEKAIPFLVQPEATVPGRAIWYASTCGGCNAGCGVLVKNRDGRPIKLEGNPDHPLSQGGLCAIGQACILELYDSHRPADPSIGGQKVTWTELDGKLMERLEHIRQNGGAVRLLTGTITSPTSRSMIQQFLAGFADARHVTYDAVSCSAILDAHQRTHGQRVLPRFRFDRADVIVGLDADFLGTWISPVEYTAAYRALRRLESDPIRRSYHVQIEARMSLTGANADRRIVVAPDEYTRVAVSLAASLAEKVGVELPLRVTVEPAIQDVAERLWQAHGHSLIVCGVNDVDTQVWISFCNHLLGNYGRTLDVEQPSYQMAGDDRAVKALFDEILTGQVAALIVRGVNPAYDLAALGDWSKALSRVPCVVNVTETHNETSALAHYVCPEPHFLERWDDSEPAAGVAAVTQPVIQRLGRTRTLAECLSAWMGRPRSDREIVQAFWMDAIYARRQSGDEPQRFWDQTVHDGYANIHASATALSPFQTAALPAGPPAPSETVSANDLQLVLYPKVTLREGTHAHNPWLQELPDPISRIAWDNYASLAPAAAARMGVREGDVLKLTVSHTEGGEREIELPVHIQPGQHDRIVAVALGYGRMGTERFAEIGPQWLEARPSVGPTGRVGVHAAPLLRYRGDHLCYTNTITRAVKTGRRHALAAIQSYDSLTVPAGMAPHGQEKRHEIVREISLAALTDSAGRSPATRPAPPSLWPEHRYDGHRWGMVIDLDACTGCGGCVLACQIENNIPVVGKDEMARSREMHWLRIDRYFAEHEGRTDVTFQPMLCHHCENAPCETVCPVLATVHSTEGLNQQVYNRCVGTRYCANNCPYKMRRFNWFDYAHQDALENMILNPDVTVRSRGVMEKCSFCVQRIEAAKIESRGENRPIRDGEVQPACQQSCPARAIVFGDMNDPDSKISRLMRSPRYYRALEELNVRPAVGYLMVVNDENDPKGTHHG